jgi:hypothetical protein
MKDLFRAGLFWSGFPARFRRTATATSSYYGKTQITGPDRKKPVQSGSNTDQT